MSRATPSTLTESFSWDPKRYDPRSELLHLVICWSLDEPDRIGEAAPLDGRCVLGRGGPHAQDSVPRVVFHRLRPEGSVVTAPLAAPRISRVQLELAPAGDGRLLVRSVGRCGMLVRGDAVEQAELGPGDTLVLRDALVLLLAARRSFRDPLGLYPDLRFPFGGPDLHGIIGESPPAWTLRNELALAALSDQHVLLLGESGTGKELAAHSLHALSRRSGRFVSRNAATFPEGLVDAELFGTAKGYPDSASPERPGLIAEADGGTLFLDEIGELPVALQARLLRVLDREGEYQRLGDTRIRRSNLRVIAATNRPVDSLKHDVAARFAVRVNIPGFDQRREDIPLLLRHLLLRAAKATPTVERIFERRAGALAEPRIDSLLIDALVRHRYTHHTRELERLMWVALSSSHGSFLALTPEVRAEMQRSAVAQPPAQESPISRAQIEAALREAAGNVTEAARALGLSSRFVLYRLMKRHGLAPPGKDGSEA